jgi:hypothetical protein
MTMDDLASIPDLQAKHRKVLTELGITTRDELAAADAKELSAAMGRMRPRPTLAEVRRWQGAARRGAGSRADGSDWERAATFVVSFEQRARGGASERQLVAEQTELEPEQPPRVWPGWDCREICGWMAGRIAAAEQMEAPARKDTAPARRTRRQNGASAPIHIEVVGLANEAGEVDPISEPRDGVREILEVSETDRAVIAVGGVNPDQVVLVVVRVQRRGRPGRNVHEPIPHRGLGRVQLPLAGVAVGTHDAKVLAWAPDRSVAAAAVELPVLVRRR